ncbi:MAG: hypothetical protein PVG39_07950 [Desulfobacteraceae bacterium]
MSIKLIGRKGATACKVICKETDMLRYKGKTKTMPDALVNYGLAGSRLKAFYKLYPSAENIPTINKMVGYSKYRVCKMAEDQGIRIPDTKLELSAGDNKDEWLRKKFHSIGGKGIEIAKTRGKLTDGYYQKYINNRVYELRVHAFLWTDSKNWAVRKRFGAPGTIAWNHKNGGHFVTVNEPNKYRVFREAKEVSEKILIMLNMGFGATDFVVDTDYNVYFLEVNAAPGFAKLSRPTYINAFAELKKLSKKELLKLAI